MSIFGSEYASLYDLFHSNKDYKSEVDNLLKLLSNHDFSDSILDFGCGSGIHAHEFLSRGIKVDGFDKSQEMINLARIRNPEAIFESTLGNLRSNYGVVYSVFDVMSYQENQLKLQEFFVQISSVTRFGGQVIVDSWHGPGVRVSPPGISRRSVSLNGKIYERVVEPRESGVSDQYDLQISIKDISQDTLLTSELHQLRAWNVDEVENSLKGTGLSITSTFDPKAPGHPLSEDSWRFGLLLTKDPF